MDLLLKKQLAELEKISQLTFEEARELLLANVENKITREMAIMIKNKEAEAKAEADKKAREIISCAIQKNALRIMCRNPLSRWSRYPATK